MYIHSWLFWCSHLKVKRLPLLRGSSSGGPVYRQSSVSLSSLLASAVEHPSVPESPEFVRVRSYESQMVIRPHKSFDEVSRTSSEMWWVSGIFSRNAFCLNWGGHLQLGLHRIHWSLLKQCWAVAWEFACLKLPGEAGAAGLGTTLQDPSCGVVYLENPWDKVVMTPWLLLPEGQSWEDGGPDSYRLVGRILRSRSERPFRQNFPTVGRTRNTFLDSYFLINAVCFLKHFMTFLCKEYFLQLSVVFCFWCFSQTSVERTYWLWWLLFLVLFTLKSLCFSPSVTCVLELYDCSLSHAFVFSKLFYLHHLYNGTLLSVTETVVCLSQCGGLQGAVCWRLYCFRAMWVLFCTWDLHHQGSNPYIGSSES